MRRFARTLALENLIRVTTSLLKRMTWLAITRILVAVIKACVPMHTFGHPVRIDEIAAICKEWHIELVEDAAESIGSKVQGHTYRYFGKIGALASMATRPSPPVVAV
jgi:dTDP-4-amino-4,6-dideoxygalactose transaminase